MDNDINFSSDMMSVLSLLSQDDLSLIVLKCQDSYSDEDLSNNFNLYVSEIRKKEIQILSSLRDNIDIKVLVKSQKNN